MDVPVRYCLGTAAIGGRGTFLLAGAGVCSVAGRWAMPFTEMLPFTVPWLTMHKPAIHRGVLYSSMEMEFGMESGLPWLEFRVIKGFIFPFLAETIGGILVKSKLVDFVLTFFWPKKK